MPVPLIRIIVTSVKNADRMIRRTGDGWIDGKKLESDHLRKFGPTRI
jgi:hypothetical protein